jgi:hypothetical protein
MEAIYIETERERWLVVKVVKWSSYKYRLGPGRVLPSSPVPELSIDYQIHKYILPEYHSCRSLIIWDLILAVAHSNDVAIRIDSWNSAKVIQISPHDRHSPTPDVTGLDRPNETSYPRGRYLRFPYNSTMVYSGIGTHKHQDDHTASYNI